MLEILSLSMQNNTFRCLPPQENYDRAETLRNKFRGRVIEPHTLPSMTGAV